MIFIEDHGFQRRRKGLMDDEELFRIFFKAKGHFMKPRTINAMMLAKEKIERGTATPAHVWEVLPDGRGGFTRRTIAPKAFRRAQRTAWDKSIAATREKLGLSQSRFARLLGISVRTLHHWEQGSRTPSGAAQVLLRVAALHPEAVLEAAA